MSSWDVAQRAGHVTFADFRAFKDTAESVIEQNEQNVVSKPCHSHAYGGQRVSRIPGLLGKAQKVVLTTSIVLS